MAININDYKTMAQRICEILEDDVLYERLSDNAIKLIKSFSKESVLLELTLISCGYNLYKYHNKKNQTNNNKRNNIHI